MSIRNLRNAGHGSLTLEHGSLTLEHGSLKLKHASLKLEHGSLKLEHGSLKLEHGSLKLEHGSLKLKPGSLKLEQAFQRFTNIQAFQRMTIEIDVTSQSYCFVCLSSRLQPARSTSSRLGSSKRPPALSRWLQ